MGFIPPDLDEAVVTNDFPLFDFAENVNPKYFGYFTNTNYFDRACKKASEGSTNRVRLKMDKFYNIEMPLPDKERQVEVVTMLDKVHQIKKQQQLSNTELKTIFPSVVDKAFKGEW
ncbi:MAG: restriction endonuclease subunit S [Chitinophagaceae bacterium]